MEINETIGIDISKLKIDVHIHSNKSFEVFENSSTGFRQMVKWFYKSTAHPREETLFVFEHTGLYSYQLSVYLTGLQIPFALVPGLAIKRSLGIARGKDDKVDAKKIALYGYRLRNEIEPYEMPSDALNILKSLLSLRERLVKQRSGFKASLREMKRILCNKDNQVLLDTQEQLIKTLSKKILRLEMEMERIIKSDEQLAELFGLVTSIKGVGAQIALYMIVSTAAFTKFRNARKFGSYCGIAPFPNSSGTSIRGKTKVSNLANKKLKSLLDLGAKSAIQHNQEMKIYYENRVEKGKNKMATVNIIRNKLVARIFAAVERKTPYVDILKFAA